MPTADIIYLRELKVEMFIGVHAWEQRIKQAIIFDLELTFDIRKAANSESIADSIDYAEVAEKIKQLAASRTFILLETLVEAVANLLLQTFNVSQVRVRANKVAAVPHVKEVGIIIERIAS